MEIIERRREGVAVVAVEGKLVGTLHGGTDLANFVLGRLSDDALPRRVLLDLHRCTGADSLGVGELISLHVSLANQGGALKLLHLPAEIRHLLQATQLISMFQVFDDEAAAIASFG